jgi:hypothetical protein
VKVKSTIFWDITQCSPLKFNRGFGRTYRLYLQGRWRRYVPPKRGLSFNGPHGVISQKIVHFITIAVRTSNPTYCKGVGNKQSTLERRLAHLKVVVNKQLMVTAILIINYLCICSLDWLTLFTNVYNFIYLPH